MKMRQQSNGTTTRLLAVLLLATALLLVAVFKIYGHQMPVMEPVSTTTQQCTSTCSNSQMPAQAADSQDKVKDAEPDPDKTIPWYMALIRPLAPKKLGDQYAARARLIRPPDLVKLYVNFRF